VRSAASPGARALYERTDSHSVFHFDLMLRLSLSRRFEVKKRSDLLPYLMDLHVPPELEAKLTRLAAESGRNVDQVALDLLTSSVDHDEWFRREVERGRTSAREGRLLDHDAVASRISQRYRG
jgi:predicted transcriptional regulator